MKFESQSIFLKKHIHDFLQNGIWNSLNKLYNDI